MPINKPPRWFRETLRCAREGVPQADWPRLGTCAICATGEKVMVTHHQDGRWFCEWCARQYEEYNEIYAEMLRSQRKGRFVNDVLGLLVFPFGTGFMIYWLWGIFT